MEAIRAAPQPNLTLADYTIGWICTKHIEYDAAQLFLDETHPDITPGGGGRRYTLGKIAECNVVIANMAGVVGEEATAALFICDMKSAFPNIYINLMVGIGSGAPSLTHDIRLGDVVVSAPDLDIWLGDVVVSAPDLERGSPAVFAYDFKEDGTLYETTRDLNIPLPFLMTLVGRFHTRYEKDGHHIEKDISSILEKKPGLRQKYGRPQSSSDRLYKSTVNSPSNTEGRTISRENDVSMLVQRPERARNKANPCIHHGTIASSSQVMEDAIIRDKLIRENNDIVCFDTEVVWVFMFNVPGLVVRGICDYSDSHKNKEWQGYAAMTAAAYAKDIVRDIPPPSRFGERMS